MNEKVKAFIELVKADPELAEKLASMTADELIATANAKGIDLTAEDFAPADGQLDDADLDNVAGGFDAALLSATNTATAGSPIILGITDTATSSATASAKSCICLGRGYGY